MSPLLQPFVIALLVIVEVGVFHLRVALASRGRKRRAALLGAVNAVISVAALGQVLGDLDRIGNIVGYAVGVYLGCLADARLAPGWPPTPSSTGWWCRARAPCWPSSSGRAAGRSPCTRRTAFVDRSQSCSWLAPPPAPGTGRRSRRAGARRVPHQHPVALGGIGPVAPAYLTVGAGRALLGGRRAGIGP